MRTKLGAIRSETPDGSAKVILKIALAEHLQNGATFQIHTVKFASTTLRTDPGTHDHTVGFLCQLPVVKAAADFPAGITRVPQQ